MVTSVKYIFILPFLIKSLFLPLSGKRTSETKIIYVVPINQTGIPIEVKLNNSRDP